MVEILLLAIVLLLVFGAAAVRGGILAMLYSLGALALFCLWGLPFVIFFGWGALLLPVFVVAVLATCVALAVLIGWLRDNYYRFRWWF